MATLEDFKKLGLKVGKVVEVKDHPNATKLYILTVDLGDEKRTLVAGLKGIYSKEELLNKNVVVVTNLEPKVIRGVKSEGMILAAEKNGKVVLITTDKDIEPGAEVL